MFLQKLEKYKWRMALLLLIGFVATSYLQSKIIHLESRTGHVLDENGQPIAGAIVFGIRQVYEKQDMNFHGYSRDRCAVVDSALTDEMGRFQLPSHWTYSQPGWSPESENLQIHVLADKYAPNMVGRYQALVSYEISAQQEITPEIEIEIRMQLVSPDAKLFVSPRLLEVVQDCLVKRADLKPALPGFASVFDRAELDAEPIELRQWLNALGQIAVQLKFPNGLPVNIDDLSNEQIKGLLSEDPESAIQQLRLRKAIVENDAQLVRVLVEHGVDPNAPDGFLRSRLWLALDNGAYESYQALREIGAMWRPGEPEMLLYKMTKQGDERAILLLADEGADPTFDVDGRLNTALAEAAYRGMTGALTAMLENSGNKQANPAALSKALYKAYSQNHIAAFKLLLSHGADPQLVGEKERAQLNWAVTSKPDFAFAMLEHGVLPEFTERGASNLARAISTNNRALAEAMFRAGFSPAATSVDYSALVLAARMGWKEFVMEIMQHPDTQPGKKSWWKTMSESVTGQREIFDLLLKSIPEGQAAPSLEYGCLLCGTAQMGDHVATRTLLQLGVPVDGRSKNGETALMKAAESGHAEIVELLIANGADIHLQGLGGATALAMASDGGQRERLYWAVKRGETVDGGKPMLLPQNRITEQKSVNVQPVDIEDRASHEAPLQGIEMHMLASTDVVVGSVSLRQGMPQASGDLQVVESLLKAGASPDMKDASGWTPLMRAAANGEKAIVLRLLAAGSDRKLRNADGQTAAMIAAENNQTELVEILD